MKMYKIYDRYCMKGHIQEYGSINIKKRCKRCKNKWYLNELILKIRHIFKKSI